MRKLNILSTGIIVLGHFSFSGCRMLVCSCVSFSNWYYFFSQTPLLLLPSSSSSSRPQPQPSLQYGRVLIEIIDCSYFQINVLHRKILYDNELQLEAVDLAKCWRHLFVLSFFKVSAKWKINGLFSFSCFTINWKSNFDFHSHPNCYKNNQIGHRFPLYPLVWW